MTSRRYRDLLGDRGRYMGEGDPPPPNDVPPYEPSPEELAEQEAEARALEDEARSEAEANARHRQALTKPDAALTFLLEAHRGDDCDGACPAPVGVVEVLDVNVGHHYTMMTARVVCVDGTTRCVDASTLYEPGGWDDPPSYETVYEYREG